MSPEIADIARQAFSDATRYAAYSAAGFLALGLIATVSLGRGRREEPEVEAFLGMPRSSPRHPLTRS